MHAFDCLTNNAVPLHSLLDDDKDPLTGECQIRNLASIIYALVELGDL